jgi:hypothetical protein
LFKNRLFLERNTKHRRVYNDLGLTFRNTKWTNYAAYNIKSQFFNHYARTLFILAITLMISLLLFYFYPAYSYYYAFNNVMFLFWILLDTISYYTLFYIWALSMTISSIWIFFYHYLFFNNFAGHTFKLPKKQTSLSIDNNLLPFNMLTPIQTSLTSEKWILYFWFQHNFSSSNAKLDSFVLSTFFENQSNFTYFLKTYDFFPKLFKLTYFIQLLSYSQENFSKYKHNSIFLNKTFLDLHFFFNLNSEIKSSDRNLLNLNILNHRFDCNLEQANSLLLSNKQQLFYIWNNDVTKTFKEHLNLESLITTTHNSIMWDRWLYKYSAIHRKLFKNAFKFTTAKRLSDSNMLSLSLTKQNLWFSEQISKIDLVDFFKNQFFLFFNNSSFNDIQNKRIQHQDELNKLSNLNSLNFYEKSLFWLTKRLFFTNFMGSNYTSSSPLFKINLSTKTSNFDIYFNLYMYFLNINNKNLITSHSNFTFNNDFLIDQSYTADKTSFAFDIFYANDSLDMWNLDFTSVVTHILSDNISKNNNLILINLIDKNWYERKNEIKIQFYNEKLLTFASALTEENSFLNIRNFFINDLNKF